MNWREARAKGVDKISENPKTVGREAAAAIASGRGGATNKNAIKKNPCPKCGQTGHWSYQCKNEPVYRSRPSRTQQLLSGDAAKEYTPAFPPGYEPKKEKKHKKRSRSRSPSQSSYSSASSKSGSKSGSASPSRSHSPSRSRSSSPSRSRSSSPSRSGSDSQHKNDKEPRDIESAWIKHPPKKPENDSASRSRSPSPSRKRRNVDDDRKQKE